MCIYIQCALTELLPFENIFISMFSGKSSNCFCYVDTDVNICFSFNIRNFFQHGESYRNVI